MAPVRLLDIFRMRTIFFALAWAAISITRAEENLCAPVLELKNITLQTATLKYLCSGKASSELKGLELNFRDATGGRSHIQRLELDKTEHTLEGFPSGSRYVLFVEAKHHSREVTDRSIPLEIEFLTPTRCGPVLDIKNTHLNNITFKWACTNSDPQPIEGYGLYYKKQEDQLNTRQVTVDYPHQEVTLNEIECGAKRVFFLVVERSSMIYREESNSLEATVGGPQLYPKKKDFLEVNETSVTLQLGQLHPNCPTERFKITLKQLSNNEVIKETHVEPSRKSVTLSGLQQNTEYELYVNVNENVVESGTSYTFRTFCEEKALKVPRHENILTLHPNYFVVHVDKWVCADSFAVEYRKFGLETWNVVSKDTKAEQKSLLIQGIFPGYAYDVRITAKNRFGTAVAEYKKLRYFRDDLKGCGDWKTHGDRCIKVVKDAGLLPKKEAQLVCEGFGDDINTPSLLSIKDEYEFGYKEHLELPGPVWLGLHTDNGEIFHWDDGSEVNFSNWASQPTHDKSDWCVQFQSTASDKQVGTWRRVNCNDWKHVVCEKPRLFGDLLDELRFKVYHLEKRLLEAESKIKLRNID